MRPETSCLANLVYATNTLILKFSFIKGDDMVCSLDTQMTPEMHQKITALEQDLGKILLAFRCHDMRPSELSQSELQKVREVETQLGLSLVAVDA